MHYYFAPLEGITDSIFRALHSKYFPGVDRYYTPFLSPTVHRGLTAREAREIPRADTLTYEAVPQLLTKVSEDFETDFIMEYDPSNPDADENGYVSYPNVNTVTEMTNLIDATRSYEANATAFEASKNMALTALSIGK